MKTLSEYTEEAQTALFDELDAFFAFSTEQFNKKKTEGEKYYSYQSGLIVRQGNEKEFFKRLEKIHQEGIKKDIEENGKEAIIRRELANHEAQISMSITDTVDALDGYGFTEEEIKEGYKSFFDYCVENDLF